MTPTPINPEYKAFLTELKSKIESSRYQAARAVNKELVLLYHHIGSQILKRQEIHGWGAKIIDQLSRDLHSAFPEIKGFGSRNLKYMRLFAATYLDRVGGRVTPTDLPHHRTCVVAYGGFS